MDLFHSPGTPSPGGQCAHDAPPPPNEQLQAEAEQLAALLRKQSPDAPPEVLLRVSEVLRAQKVQIDVLRRLVEYTALRVQTAQDAARSSAVCAPLTYAQIDLLLESLPFGVDPGEMLYLVIRAVERHHKVPMA